MMYSHVINKSNKIYSPAVFLGIKLGKDSFMQWPDAAIVSNHKKIDSKRQITGPK